MSPARKLTKHSQLGKMNEPELTVQQKMMAYLDGEMSKTARREFEAILEAHPEWRSEVEMFQSVLVETENLKYKPLPNDHWDGYWEEIDSELLGKPIGFVLIGFGLGLLLLVGLVYLVSLLTSPLLLVGFSILIAGIVLLYLSVLRGFIKEYKKDRYRRIKR